MGNSASSSAAVSENPSKKGLKFSGGRGRSSNSSAPPGLTPSMVSLPSETLKKLQEHEPTHNTVAEEDDESLLEESEDEYEEEDLDWEERLRVLEDARNLKKMAVFFLHPEKAVEADGFSSGRNFFSRPSAQHFTEEESEERSQIMEDLKALKKSAVDFMHPELPVETSDPNACGRNWFGRPAAYHDLDGSHAERETILEEMKQLKSLAVDYRHPELPVRSSVGVARGFVFDQGATMTPKESHERHQIMEDMKALKQAAVDYLHPELPVSVTDPTVFGRNYFSRATAPEQEPAALEEDRRAILADATALKSSAIDYMHPERPVAVDPATTARCYFDRASAPAQLSIEECEERRLILEEVGKLKSLAKDFQHPEIPVPVGDTGSRCYFDRASAPAPIALEEVEERARILSEAQQLKRLATDFMHPEIPVTPSNVGSRCFFERPSAPAEESKEEADEAQRILDEMAALKKLAVDYLHPELPVECSDPTATARCYFDRPSNILHDQMIHSFPPHDDDEHSDHHEHVDHFGLDEDVGFLNEVRDKLTGAEISQSKVNGSDEQSNLSRSPSSVMLFQEDPIYE